MSKIKAQVGSIKKATDEFVDAWKKAEQGDESVDKKLYFSDPELLIKTLTRK